MDPTQKQSVDAGRSWKETVVKFHLEIPAMHEGVSSSSVGMVTAFAWTHALLITNPSVRPEVVVCSC